MKPLNMKGTTRCDLQGLSDAHENISHALFLPHGGELQSIHGYGWTSFCHDRNRGGGGYLEWGWGLLHAGSHTSTTRVMNKSLRLSDEKGSG